MNRAIIEFIEYCPDTGKFSWKVSPSSQIPAGSPAGSIHQGYLYIGFRGKRYYAHRVAWLIMTGQEPTGLIDHKNLNKADNRWSNLREASTAQNRQNCLPRGRLPKGVTPVFNKFKAQIKANGKNLYLGLFNTPEEAHVAYAIAATKFFGEFARIAA